MAEVTWTNQALDDLRAVFLFIARDAPVVADLFVERIFNATERLAEFPMSGRVVPEISDQEIREVIVQSYRVIYRVVLEEVEILMVHHGARLVG